MSVHRAGNQVSQHGHLMLWYCCGLGSGQSTFYLSKLCAKIFNLLRKKSILKQTLYRLQY